MKKGKTIVLWILAVFFILSALVYFPSFSSLFAILTTALVIPIPKWQNILAKFIRGKLKTIVIVILIVLTIFTAPTEDTTIPTDPDDTIITESTTIPTTSEVSNQSTTEATTESSASSTEATTIPTTENTATSTEATTKPTTDTTTTSTEAIIETSTPSPTESSHTHSFTSATCTAPKTCSCGATEGGALGHSWKDATCIEPKTCTLCGTTSGLTAGHNFSSGSCTNCGKSDPNFVYASMVWIPTNGGTKYHTHAGCSNMNNPVQVTQSEAESRGFTACKRCH